MPTRFEATSELLQHSKLGDLQKKLFRCQFLRRKAKRYWSRSMSNPVVIRHSKNLQPSNLYFGKMEV